MPSTTTSSGSSMPSDYKRYIDNNICKLQKEKGYDYTLSFTKNKLFTYVVIFSTIYVFLLFTLLCYNIYYEIDLLFYIILVIKTIFAIVNIYFIIQYVVDLHKQDLSCNRYVNFYRK